LHCEDLGSDNAGDWEEFNRRSPDGSIYHTLRWKEVIERSFGYRSRYFLVYDGKVPVAICPFFEVPLKGKRSLIPPPATDIKHVVVGRPTADRSITDEITAKLTDTAKEHGCSYIIVASPAPELIESTRFVYNERPLKQYPLRVNGYFLLDLGKNDPDYIWNTLFSGKKHNQRKYIRRFEQSGFSITDSRDKKDFDRFYKYYTENLNHIGATPFDRSHFDVLFDRFSKDEIRMTFLEKEDLFAGGAMALLDAERGVMHIRYLALNRDLPGTYHPPYALFWEAIRYAHSQGLRAVCFGTNNSDENDRNYAMKKGFGSDYHHYYSEIIPANYRSRLMYAAYRRLNMLKEYEGGHVNECETRSREDGRVSEHV
jgi:hypothetical protein